MSKKLSEFINYILPIFIKKLNLYIQKLDNLETIRKYGDYEYKYHTENRLKYTDSLINVKVNDFQSAKILSFRTLIHLFNDCLENDIRNEEIIESLMQLYGNKTILRLLRYIILNSVETREILNNYINNYKKIINNALNFIDSQKYIEQKTKEWFKVRHDMISASTCGYLDHKRCKLNIDKEETQILEKSNMIAKKKFNGWSIPALKHGQQFEDISGDIYNIINQVNAKEYGILKAEDKPFIGASPDGIITEYNDNNILSILKYGRMREIKNPVSRAINNLIPNYYYYQMQQQMYVCKLPFCDFIQSSIKYPYECDLELFKKDTMTLEILNECKSWQQLSELIEPYILKNLNYDALLNDNYQFLISEPLNNLDNILLTLLVNNWNKYSFFPLSNINRRGQLKGILWSFVKYDEENNVDFKIEWLPLNESYDNYYSWMDNYIEALKNKYIKDDFILEETLYWNCESFKVIEVEYNKLMYENDVLPILENKWNLINKLRDLNSINQQDAIDEYLKNYPKSKKFNKKTHIIYDLSD